MSCNKAHYATRAHARTAARVIARFSIQPRPYYCQQCDCWHLTTWVARGKRKAPPTHRSKACLE